MAIREEVVKTIAAVFAVTTEKWDDQNYPYEDVVSLWEDHLQAYNAIENAGRHAKKDKMRIVLRHLTVLNTGRVVWHNVKPVYEAGQWVSPEHDPRAKDPQFREYLRLKEIYES